MLFVNVIFWVCLIINNLGGLLLWLWKIISVVVGMGVGVLVMFVFNVLVLDWVIVKW